MAIPVRRCVGCGRCAPITELIRFSAKNNELVIGAPGFGRGAWVCHTSGLACFDRATDRNQWSRVLKSPLTSDSVVVVRDLIRQET